VRDVQLALEAAHGFLAFFDDFLCAPTTKSMAASAAA
jgi:hypothetical protein